jgi:hypothetical protein
VPQNPKTAEMKKPIDIKQFAEDTSKINEIHSEISANILDIYGKLRGLEAAKEEKLQYLSLARSAY